MGGETLAWVTANPKDVLMQDILGPMCIGVPIEQQGRRHTTIVGAILNRLGYESKQQWNAGHPVRVYNLKPE